MDPRAYEILMEHALKKGALDVYLTPVQMKKNRPATLLSILSKEGEVNTFLSLIFSDTTTLGIRVIPVKRYSLPRTLKSIDTPYGTVRVKVAYFEGRDRCPSPEYEDCKRLSLEKGVPLMEIIQSAIMAFHKIKYD